MFELFKDGASKLKAKIGGDDLDEKLVEVVSEENWQASTQQLHEIAGAAYNYEKWQRINEFIWEKLKKSKSWKKILKTFNLIEFLLKNGPPSIISNFKYDLYQLRTFESYSNYVDGLDKGEPIRERAKAVVALLGNEELLEEERVKAKNIREKMSSVVGGGAYTNSGYGNSGASSAYGSGYGGSGHSSKYDNYDSKKKSESKPYDYGNSLGAYGDYSYNKSTLDKYKDSKNEKPSSNDYKKEEKKPEVQVETKKPFEKVASKLSKPGERKEEKVEEVKPQPTVTATTTPTTTTTASTNIIDFFEMSPPAPTQAPSQPFTFEQKPAVQAPTQVQQPVPQVPLVPQAPQVQAPVQPFPQTAPGYAPQPATGYNAYGQPQPQFPPQYPPQYGYNQFQPNPYQPQPQAQFPQFQQGPYGQPQPTQFYQQPYQAQQAYNPYAAQPAPSNPYAATAGLSGGITLNATNPKKEQDFGNFSSSSSTAQNVNWLSSTEKGLLDFSDFSSQLKKEQKKPAKQEVSNNIQIDAWSW